MEDAIALQQELEPRVDTRPSLPALRLIGGIHVAYAGDDLIAAVVVLGFPALDVVAGATAAGRTAFPYVPGLLAWRELPTVLAACERLRSQPDVILCDAHGIAHPRRFGLASHLGYCLDVPSIGCARRRLVGEHEPVAAARGSRVGLTHAGAPVGAVVRTRVGVKPVFVSPGFAVSVSDAVDVVLATTLRYRMPEPIRRAQLLANEKKRRTSAASSVTVS